MVAGEGPPAHLESGVDPEEVREGHVPRRIVGPRGGWLLETPRVERPAAEQRIKAVSVGCALADAPTEAFAMIRGTPYADTAASTTSRNASRAGARAHHGGCTSSRATYRYPNIAARMCGAT